MTIPDWRARREAIGINRERIAVAAGVAARTLQRAEAGGTVNEATRRCVEAALAEAEAEAATAQEASR